MKELLDFVNAALEAFESDIGFVGFGLDEVQYSVDDWKIKQKEYRDAKKAAAKGAAEPKAEHPKTGSYNSTSDNPRWGAPRTDKKVGSLMTKKAIGQSQRDYASKKSADLHRMAADVHKSLGNHKRAARHMKAADLVHKRDSAPPSTKDSADLRGISQRAAIVHKDKVTADKHAKDKARAPKSSLADLYKNSHH